MAPAQGVLYLGLMDGIDYKALREARGLSRRQAAAKIGVTYQAVASWEQGKHKPSREHIPKVSKVYGVSIDSLMVDAGLSPSSTGSDTEEPVTDIRPTGYAQTLTKNGGQNVDLLRYLLSDMKDAKDDIRALRQQLTSLEERLRETGGKRTKRPPQVGRRT